MGKKMLSFFFLSYMFPHIFQPHGKGREKEKNVIRNVCFPQILELQIYLTASTMETLMAGDRGRTGGNVLLQPPRSQGTLQTEQCGKSFLRYL